MLQGRPAKLHANDRSGPRDLKLEMGFSLRETAGTTKRVSARAVMDKISLRGREMDETTFRGHRITKDQVLEAMERFDKEGRGTFTNWRTYSVSHGGRDYPPKEIISMVTGLNVNQFSGGIKGANRPFHELGFEVTTLQGGPEEFMDQALDTAMSLEADLERALLTRLDALEDGLQLWREGERSGQQYNVGEAGRIDLLCTDKSNNLVVVELKAGEADHKVCGQIQAYMGWVKERLANNRRVRGIIVANEFSDKLTYAVKVAPDLSLRKYDVSFTFSPVYPAGGA